MKLLVTLFGIFNLTFVKSLSIQTCKGHQSNLPHIITQTVNIKVPLRSKMCLLIESFSVTTVNLNLSTICDITTHLEASYCPIYVSCVQKWIFSEGVDILEFTGI